MTYPNPEGLPSRIDVLNGYWVEDSMDGQWLLWRAIPGVKGAVGIAQFNAEREARAFATAMNAHTDALGAALENLWRH